MMMSMSISVALSAVVVAALIATKVTRSRPASCSCCVRRRRWAVVRGVSCCCWIEQKIAREIFHVREEMIQSSPAIF